MSIDTNTAVLNEYDKDCTLYADFTAKIYELVKELLKENAIFVHSVNPRVKSRGSLEKKLNKADRKYSRLQDVTDISGIQIITYFSDDVDKVASIVEKEFNIDKENSVDKRTLMDPDRFGYLSIHYVAQINSERLKLTEYKRFGACKVEIQVRSILQHAWAEIEHDLGYKGKLAVPREIRRKFSRLAGLLEIADSEFIEIRNSLSIYEASVKQEIAKAPSEVLVNQASLISYIENSKLVLELDESIAGITESVLVKNKEAIASDIPKLYFVDIKTIAQLDEALIENKELILKFAEIWISNKKYKDLFHGISIFYLLYVIIGKKKPEQAITYFIKFGIGHSPEEDGKRLVEILSKVT